MTVYLSIDGDDIGNKIAKAYLDNDDEMLASIVEELNSILFKIAEKLKDMGFIMIFCAADGLVCKGSELENDNFLYYLRNIGKPNFTFSVGVGSDLRTSFFALKYAKAIGKNKFVIHSSNAEFKVID
jgi:hypothetical protein